MILSFLQHWFLPVRTLLSIFTVFHSCYLLPSLITSTSFCAYLFLPLISPPGDIRCTLLSFNSTFCSPLKREENGVNVCVWEKERSLFCLFLPLPHYKIWEQNLAYCFFTTSFLSSAKMNCHEVLHFFSIMVLFFIVQIYLAYLVEK